MSEHDFDRMISVRASVIDDGEARIRELEAEVAKAHDFIEKLEASSWQQGRDNARLRECLKRLVDKLCVVHEDEQYKAVWMLWMIHNGPYNGPQYADELKAAAAALKEGE
jgi:uncharacterized coiled-coil protein SlyX